jgi:hypothetical protein
MFFRSPAVAPARLALAAVFSIFAANALAEDDGYVVYLSEYISGDYYVAALGDVDTDTPVSIQPRKLRLPWRFRRNVELGNHDVSADGQHIVFAARDTDDYDWDIFAGTIDLRYRRIRNVQRVVDSAGSRDEDPRFSWDGTQIVYKCGGSICVYPDFIYENPVVPSSCELWAPSIDQSGFNISYTKRCEEASGDRIYQYNLITGRETMIPAGSAATDRFSWYLDDGRIIYSHISSLTSGSSLWIHDAGSISLLHNRTVSDDDPYPDKHDRNHIAFIGWENGGYNLFIYRRDRDNSVRLTDGRPILSPVLFRQ